MPQPRLVSVDPARYQRVSGLHVLRVAGDDYEMGFQHGALLRDAIDRGPVPYFERYIERMLAAAAGPVAGRLLAGLLGHTVGRRIGAGFPRHALDALHGLADGAGLARAPLVRAVTMPESYLWLLRRVMDLHPLGAAPRHGVPLMGCTSAVAWGDAALGGAHAARSQLRLPGCGRVGSRAGRRIPPSVQRAAVRLRLGSGHLVRGHHRDERRGAHAGGAPAHGVARHAPRRRADRHRGRRGDAPRAKPRRCPTDPRRAPPQRLLDVRPFVGARSGGALLRGHAGRARELPRRRRRVWLQQHLSRSRAGTQRAAPVPVAVAQQHRALSPRARAPRRRARPRRRRRHRGDPRRPRRRVSALRRDRHADDGRLGGVPAGSPRRVRRDRACADVESTVRRIRPGARGGCARICLCFAAACPTTRAGWRRSTPTATRTRRTSTRATSRSRARAWRAPWRASHCSRCTGSSRHSWRCSTATRRRRSRLLDRAIERGHEHPERVAAFHLWRARARDVRGRRGDALGDYRATSGGDAAVRRAARRGLMAPWKPRRFAVEFALGDVPTP